jgi:hypothetical protein
MNDLNDFCQYCGNGIYHCGGKCPKVKKISYHENGMIKEVEFFEDLPWWSTLPQTWISETKEEK